MVLMKDGFAAPLDILFRVNGYCHNMGSQPRRGSTSSNTTAAGDLWQRLHKREIHVHLHTRSVKEANKQMTKKEHINTTLII